MADRENPDRRAIDVHGVVLWHYKLPTCVGPSWSRLRTPSRRLFSPEAKVLCAAPAALNDRKARQRSLALAPRLRLVSLWPGLWPYNRGVDETTVTQERSRAYRLSFGERSGM